MELSREERLLYYDTVAEIDENSFWADLKASQLCASIGYLDISYDEEERAQLLAWSAAILDLDRRREEYGACAEPMIVSLFEFSDPMERFSRSSCSSQSYN
jgi:hypothetical protein